MVNTDAPMAERVKLWRVDYPYFALDLQGRLHKIEQLRPLVGKEMLAGWMALAMDQRVDELFERVMAQHYDPCYQRSTRHSYGPRCESERLVLKSLVPISVANAVRQLVLLEREFR